jgi:hypothetical protein
MEAQKEGFHGDVEVACALGGLREAEHAATVTLCHKSDVELRIDLIMMIHLC